MTVNNLFDAYRLISKRPAEFWLFLVVNFVLGGLGLWLGPVAAAFASRDVGEEFVKSLSGSTGYFLSIALIASSASFFVREYISNKSVDAFREIKSILGLAVFVWILLLLAIVSILTTVNLGAALGGTAMTKFAWTHGYTLQIVLTALSFAVAAFLFCVEHINEFPEQFAGWKTEKQKELNEQIDATKSDQLKV